jgi:fatty acid desaturase
MRPDDPQAIRRTAHALAHARLWAVPRILLDFALWAVAAWLAHAADTTWAVCLAVLFIGAVPMHDLLVHGHDGTHRLVARTRWLNELFTFLNHALVGISGSAYRAFHLDHHRHAQTELDPESRLLRRLSGGRGWGYLLLPLVSHVAVNGYPFYARKSAAVRRAVVRDLLGALLLHGGLLRGLGHTAYLSYVVAPVFTSLAAVVIVRSICEHHGKARADGWANTRGMRASTLFGFLWSNTHYHLERASRSSWERRSRSPPSPSSPVSSWISTS